MKYVWLTFVFLKRNNGLIQPSVDGATAGLFEKLLKVNFVLYFGRIKSKLKEEPVFNSLNIVH